MPDGGPITIAGVDGLRTGDGPIFAVIGVFDGIHRGHQYLLRHLDLHRADRHSNQQFVISDPPQPTGLRVKLRRVERLRRGRSVIGRITEAPTKLFRHNRRRA